MGLWIPSGLSSSEEPPTPPLPDIVTWTSGTDEQIIAMLEAHYQGILDIHDYWSVGDARNITLSAMSAAYNEQAQTQQSFDFVLTHAGGKYLADGVTECAFQVDQRYCFNTSNRMNATAINKKGWGGSIMRSWCNDTYYNAIPSSIRGIFKQFINQTGTGNGSTSGVENTIDYFALRAEVEIFGSTTYSVSGEGSQIKWYETVANRNKYVNGSLGSWWLRSPRSGNTKQFCQAAYVAGYQNSCDNANNAKGTAPFGVI